MWQRKRMSDTNKRSPDARITTFVDDELEFVVDGRRFVVLSAPGGETPDSVFVWIPEERTVFTGNHAGALYLAMPNFTTIRGDRLRSARKFIQDVDTLLALDPPLELLITGHEEAIRGEGQIRADLSRIRDAVQYVYDATIEGMNAGKSLHTLMREIELPPALELAPGRAPTSWTVRAIWEEYTGWFRFESPTELYGVPPSAIWSDLAELAGTDELAARAAARLEEGRPVEALHLAEIALSADPGHSRARETQIGALEALIDLGRGSAYDEITYLESEVGTARELLTQPDTVS
jgi:alkyl sulfatase BDS1-like metallo-beta-lactamase superfamily hydrolase